MVTRKISLDNSDTSKPKSVLKNILSNFENFKGSLSRFQAMAIVQDLVKRGRLYYGLRDIIKYYLNCLCLKKPASLKGNIHSRKHLLYKRGEERIVNELDVGHMIKSNA
jgi:hypothetical protein